MSERPIGVYDSGVGGLTVVRELLGRAPGESFIYLGDTARFPYGDKSPAELKAFARQAALFLDGVKHLIIACNTASAYGLEAARSVNPAPVTGVIHAGARAAAAVTRTGPIGVIATTATTRSQAYLVALREAGHRGPVHSLACPRLVSLVETGGAQSDAAVAVAGEELAPLRGLRLAGLILGCSHLPFVKEPIAAAFGEQVALIDPAEATVAEVLGTLAQYGELAPGRQGQGRFYVSKDPEAFARAGGPLLGRPITGVTLMAWNEEGGGHGQPA